MTCHGRRMILYILSDIVVQHMLSLFSADSIFVSISDSTLHMLIGQFVKYSVKLDKIQPSHHRLRVNWCLR